MDVIPAEAGIHLDLKRFAIHRASAKWIPAFAGMTT